MNRRPVSTTIKALISDVDGTLVHKDKSLADKTVQAVARLQKAGLKFTIVSSRPPRGLKTLIRDLHVTQPVAGFNGGIVASAELSTISKHLIAPDVAQAAVKAIETSGAHAWVFSGEDWFIRDPHGPRVDLETRTVGFAPTVVGDFSTAIGTAAKIVAVSDDFARLTQLQNDVRSTLSGGANIVRSQNYYLDFTHPLANKGQAVFELTKLIGVSANETAVIGDGENDLDMFAQAGLSIAMGNGSAEVQGAADFITRPNDQEGVAAAIDWFILGGHREPFTDENSPERA